MNKQEINNYDDHERERLMDRLRELETTFRCLGIHG